MAAAAGSPPVTVTGMVKLPLLHEALTGCMSLGHLLAGDAATAAALWAGYREESVLGSGAASALSALWGDAAEAERLGRGLGRATGQALLGGGLLSDVPVLKELSKCGKSLGDLIGGGDVEFARKRWTVEWHNEVTEPGALPKALVSVSMASGGLLVCLASSGLAAPAYVAFSAVAGAAFTAGGAAACQGIDQLSGFRDLGDFSAGDMIGCAIVGAVGCGGTGAAGCIAADVVIQPWEVRLLGSRPCDVVPAQLRLLQPVGQPAWKCEAAHEGDGHDDGPRDARARAPVPAASGPAARPRQGLCTGPPPGRAQCQPRVRGARVRRG
ncbi:unnamed protein product [Prorocentrum cordatum]|uniref:H(+)-exporting diphosphatase n=1 Tax=Prorocentrum cordatum TaxID=2364126 RepID=A0ABN9TJW6_9DINO|nr:unnamed protein product [Polarella glacialis]